MACKRFTLALIQMRVVEEKLENIKLASSLIKQAATKGSKIIALPECFNCPYGTKYFPKYAENIPQGDTCQSLSETAKANNVYIVGGSIPEKDGHSVYNTCTVWDPQGKLVAKHRKVHLFDIDIKGGVRFKESETLTAGDALTCVETEFCKIGLGICYDIRFEEMARLYQKQGCDMIIYPGSFNMSTGPLHWELLFRSRAVDNQVFTVGISPAQDKTADYISYGHSIAVSPWGKIITQAEFDQDILYANIDLSELDAIRQQIPVGYQRRHDLYETISKV